MIVKGRPIDEDEVIDKYLNMNLIFDVGTNNDFRGTVVKRSQELDRIAIGNSNTNSFFDTHEYDIYFKDGTQDKYSTNLIAENMYAHVDDEGNQFQLLAEIQDYRKDGTEISK